MATSDEIVALGPDLIPSAHALNQQFSIELSDDSLEHFKKLVAVSVRARVIGDMAGFFLAFDEATPDQGLNHVWFKARYPRFLYIDRVAVRPERHGQGLARRLYGETLHWAAASGYPNVVCEVNVRPPNPRSDAFHAALGFTEVDQREFSDGKVVRYLCRALTPP